MLCGPSMSAGMTPTGTTLSTTRALPSGRSQVMMSPDSLTTPTRYAAVVVWAASGAATSANPNRNVPRIPSLRRMSRGTEVNRPPPVPPPRPR